MLGGPRLAILAGIFLMMRQPTIRNAAMNLALKMRARSPDAKICAGIYSFLGLIFFILSRIDTLFLPDWIATASVIFSGLALLSILYKSYWPIPVDFVKAQTILYSADGWKDKIEKLKTAVHPSFPTWQQNFTNSPTWMNIQFMLYTRALNEYPLTRMFVGLIIARRNLAMVNTYLISSFPKLNKISSYLTRADRPLYVVAITLEFMLVPLLWLLVIPKGSGAIMRALFFSMPFYHHMMARVKSPKAGKTYRNILDSILTKVASATKGIVSPEITKKIEARCAMIRAISA